MVVVCAVMLFGGYLLKAQCLDPWDGTQYERVCYNDIQPLYSLRGVQERTFPYIDGGLEAGQLVGGAIEYPVLTGVFMWASGALASDPNQYLRVSALLLAPFGLLTAYGLGLMSGRRALLWAAAPALVLYAFHNWDVLVVATAVGGMYAWWRGRFVWSAVLFGIGGALKMYPALFLLPLALERLVAGDKRGAIQSAGAGFGALALVNLPFALLNFEGWWATYEFHRVRTANYDSVWALAFPSDFAGIRLPALAPSKLNLLTAALTAVSIVLVLWWSLRRSRVEGKFPFLAASGALLATFLLWNKVHSPQYTLWILPFFVVLRVHIGWWIAYTLADIAVYVGIFRWFYDAFILQDQSFTWAKRMWIYGVWGRALLLVGLVAVFARAGPALDEPEAVATENLSQGPTRVGPVGERLPAEG